MTPYNELFNQADKQYDAKQYAAAMQLWQWALDHTMDLEEQSRCRHNISCCLIELGRFSEALPIAEAVAALMNGRPNGQKLFEKAKSNLNCARLRLDKEKASRIFEKGSKALDAGDLEEAYRHWDRAKRLRNDKDWQCRCMINMALCCYRLGKIKAAHTFMIELDRLVVDGCLQDDEVTLELFYRHRERVRIEYNAREARQLMEEANVHIGNDDYARAESTAEAALSELDRAATRECLLGALIMERLGLAVYKQDRASEARQLWTAAQRLAEKWAKDENAGLAERIRNNLDRCEA